VRDLGQFLYYACNVMIAFCNHAVISHRHRLSLKIEVQLQKQASACGEIVMAKIEASENGAADRTAVRTDVLIVGAGPVGLALAVELGLRDIDCRLVERVPEISHWWTRAMNMNKRTMEHMRRWGLAEDLKRVNFVPPGWPGNVTAVDTLGGRPLATARAEGVGWHRTLDDAAEDALWVAQGQVQNQLLEKAGNLGVNIAFSSEAMSVVVAEDGCVEVEVENQQTHTRQRITARYVVGCDGGRSIVRQAAGIAYRGPGALSRQVMTFFRAPDLLADMRRRKIPDSVMYLCAEAACAGLARLIAGDRWEFTYNLPAGVQESDLDPNALIRSVVGPDIAFEIERSVPFSYFVAVADRLREGPLFIAGDAAHVIPPLGGHNLNVGFNDAVNLGWKLAHVLRGWASERILDSYGPERLPMIHRTASEAFDNYERWQSTFVRLSEAMAIEGDNEDAWNKRLELSQVIARDLEPQWHSDGTVLDQRYSDSPIVAREMSSAPPYDRAKNQPFAAPGHRAPLKRSSEGVPLYDFFGDEYTLLDLAEAPNNGLYVIRHLVDAGIPVKHLRLDDPDLRTLYGADLTLIRPDQQVFWRGDARLENFAELIDILTGRVLEVAGGTVRASSSAIEPRRRC
jgi:2-polyprenyl-6-methoxyphenol hydroxylase-like FAD-dependent oxidoreductase